MLVELAQRPSAVVTALSAVLAGVLAWVAELFDLLGRYFALYLLPMVFGVIRVWFRSIVAERVQTKYHLLLHRVAAVSLDLLVHSLTALLHKRLRWRALVILLL